MSSTADVLGKIKMAELMLAGAHFGVASDEVRAAGVVVAEVLAELKASLALVYDLCETFDVPLPLVYTERVEALLAKAA